MTFVVTQTPEERLAGLTVPDGGCLIFTGTKNNFGYGWFWFEGKNVLVHRWVWQNEHGPIPKGAEIHHTCNRKLCVNPEHLEMMKDRAAHWEATIPLQNSPHAKNAQKTHCVHGHELVGENLGIVHCGNRKPQRFCRTCQRLRQRRYYHAKKLVRGERCG